MCSLPGSLGPITVRSTAKGSISIHRIEKKGRMTLICKREKVCSGCDGNRENPVLLVGEGTVRWTAARPEERVALQQTGEVGRPAGMSLYSTAKEQATPGPAKPSRWSHPPGHRWGVGRTGANTDSWTWEGLEP